MVYDFEQELKNKIVAKYKELEQMQQITKSMLAGPSIKEELLKSDYDAFLSFYRERVETVNLMHLYNEWFPGSELEKIEKETHEQIEKLEGIIIDLMLGKRRIR